MTSEPPQAAVGEVRLRRLARLTDVLSEAITTSDAIKAVAAAGAHELDADSVAVFLLSKDGSTYHMAASDGVRVDVAETWASFSSDAPVLVVDAVRDQQLVIVDGVEERERRYPVFGRGPISSETLVGAPMIVNGQTVIGALSIGFAERRHLDEVDRAFIEVVAKLCGVAVHRARLYEYQQRMLARQRFLGNAATLLAAELDQTRTLYQVARLAVAELADVCAVCLVDDDDQLRPAVAVHRDPEGQRVVDELVAEQPIISDERLLQVARTAEAMFVPVVTVTDDPVHGDEGHRQLIDALGATSVIVVPMRARGRLLGLLLLLRTSGQAELDEGDRTVAKKLATWSSLALDNARLYAEKVELVDHLQAALSSHRAIEQAKGILAARLGMSTTEAFNHMRRHARANRRKIEDLADDVVAGRDDLDG